MDDELNHELMLEVEPERSKSLYHVGMLESWRVGLLLQFVVSLFFRISECFETILALQIEETIQLSNFPTFQR